MSDSEPNSFSDQELIQSANAGEPDAFEQLYYRYRDWVYNLAWRFTGDRDQAMDVLQETFAYLLQKFPGFVLTARMTTFLYPVVKHLSIAVRDKGRRFASSDESLDEIPKPPQAHATADRQELSAVLAVLPVGQREVLLLRFVDGLSLKEIAKALEIPSGTVKSRLHNALETLRRDGRTRKYFLE